MNEKMLEYRSVIEKYEKMLEYRSVLEKYDKLLRISSRIDSILSRVLNILSGLSYKTWCCQCFSLEEILQFHDIYMSFAEEPGKYVREPIESISICLDRLIHMMRGMYGDSFSQEEIKTIESVEHSSKISAILNGKLPKRDSSQLEVSLYGIMYWLILRTEVKGALLLIHAKKEEDTLTIRGLLEQWENTLSSPKAQNELSHIADQLHYADLFKEGSAESIDMSRSISYIEDDIKAMLKHWQRLKCVLFQILNHIFIPVKVKRDIFAIIKHSIFGKSLQQEYDIHRSFQPLMFPWDFNPSNQNKINTVLPADFNTGERIPTSSMNLNLDHLQVTNLYHALRGKYINERTDILDFAFSLTGYPVERGKVFNKIIWVHPHKQTLGFFLGMLCPGSTKMGKYWKVASEFFCYQSRENTLTPGQLSSPYNNQLNHSEVRREDWTELESIIETCVKTQKK